MKSHVRFHQYGHPETGVVAGIFDSKRKRFHDRLQYTRAGAQQVVDWLNGQDQPLQIMMRREYDPWDPARPRDRRGQEGHAILDVRACS